jgi:hypothetical protein
MNQRISPYALSQFTEINIGASPSGSVAILKDYKNKRQLRNLATKTLQEVNEVNTNELLENLTGSLYEIQDIKTSDITMQKIGEELFDEILKPAR